MQNKLNASNCISAERVQSVLAQMRTGPDPTDQVATIATSEESRARIALSTRKYNYRRMLYLTFMNHLNDLDKFVHKIVTYPDLIGI